jgi:small multidrug resistance pump
MRFGITAIEVIGVVYFKESMSISKILFIALILIGTVGLNFSRSS